MRARVDCAYAFFGNPILRIRYECELDFIETGIHAKGRSENCGLFLFLENVMSVRAAYVGIVLIWSTTPLTVKWSGEDVGFLFGVTGRMLIGTVLSLLVMRLAGIRLPMHKRAQTTYLVSALGIFGGMFFVYWSAQYIPSGFISVIFAVAPITTGLLATVLLKERNFGFRKLLGFALGFGGILTVFYSGLVLGGDTWKGVIGTLFSVIAFSLSGVLIKKYGEELHALAANTGGLVYGSLLFLLLWMMFDGHVPQTMSGRTAGSILYLAVIGTVIGFTLYMYLLQNQSPGSLAMITLVTPVTAIYLGSLLNDEVIGSSVWYGTAMITSGLLLYTAPGNLRKYLGSK